VFIKIARNLIKMKSSGGFTAEQFSARYKKLSKEEKQALRKMMMEVESSVCSVGWKRNWIR